MVRKSLLVAALLAVAGAPAGAQQEDFEWDGARPDGVAPIGLYADRTLDGGDLELAFLFERFYHQGVRFGTGFLTPVEVQEDFTVFPLAMRSETFAARAGWGMTDKLTLAARVGFVRRSREQLTEELLFETDASGLTDMEVTGIYQIHREGPWRANVQAGLIVPIGASDEVGDFPIGAAEQPVTYDQQPAAGAWGFVPGATVQVMNEVGSVGAQIRGEMYFDANGAGWEPGDRIDANAWIAYRFTDWISASARVHGMAWDAIDGFDPNLDPTRDPAALPILSSGERVDLPVGVNIYFPEGRWMGHRVSLEMVYTVHEDYDTPWTSADWGFVVGWRTVF